MAIILTLEDPRNNNHLVSGRLQAMHHDVLKTRDMGLALQVFSSNKERLQIVIADFLLPHQQKGTSFIKHVQQTAPWATTALIAHGALDGSARKIDGIPVIRRSLMTEELQEWVDQQLRRQVGSPRQIPQKRYANE